MLILRPPSRHLTQRSIFGRGRKVRGRELHPDHYQQLAQYATSNFESTRNNKSGMLLPRTTFFINLATVDDADDATRLILALKGPCVEERARGQLIRKIPQTP